MKVLIAIDGSKYSNTAVDSVTERFWPDKTEFCIVMVLPSPPTVRDYNFVEAKLTQLKRIFRSNKITSTLVVGGIVESIIETAKECDADLIIVGSHGRKGLKKLLFGSIAEEVVRNAPCSVEIVMDKFPGQSKLVKPTEHNFEYESAGVPEIML